MSAIGSVRRVVPDAIRERYVLKVGIAITAVILVTAAIGGYMYLETSSELRADAKHQLSAAAESQTVSMEDWRNNIISTTNTLAQSSEVMRGYPREISGYLEGQLSAGRLPPSVIDVHYLNLTSGAFAASTRTDYEGSNLTAQRVPWADTVEGWSKWQTLITEPYQVPGNHTHGMAVLAPVPPESDHAIVMVVSLDDRIEELPRPVENGEIAVVDGDGTVIMSHDTSRIGTQNMGDAGVDSTAVKNAISGQTGFTQMTMGGQKLAMGYAPVENSNWSVLVRAPSSSVFSVQSTVSQNLLVMLLVAIIGLGLVGATIGRNTARDLRRLATRAESIEDGDFDTRVESGREDEIGRLYDSIADLRDSLHENIREAEEAREEAERRQERIQREAEHLEETAERYHEVMNAAAAGDLTRRMEPSEENEAMAEIAEAFNGMMDELETTLAQVKQFAATVAESSGDVQTSAVEVKTASQEVSESIQEISHGASVQNENLAEVSAEMNDLSATIEEVASSAAEASETAQQTEELGHDVQEVAEEVEMTMSEVRREADESVAEIEALQEEMAEIEEIVDFITDVAEQTNILALNASIEAARAGEAGEGFAVVADEVKSLAEETRDAAEEIEELIGSIQDQSAETAREVGETNEEVAEAAAKVQTSIDSLETIADFAEETNTAVQEISDATDEQATSTQEVVSMIDEVSSVSEQTNEEAQTVSAAAEEQTSAITDVVSRIEDLADRSEDLDGALAEFETEFGGSVSDLDDVAAATGDAENGAAEDPLAGVDREAPMGPETDSTVVDESAEVVADEDADAVSDGAGDFEFEGDGAADGQ
ncbi:MAG: methyl-accepting chemotaxis protein [Haloplanus sp.]